MKKMQKRIGIWLLIWMLGAGGANLIQEMDTAVKGVTVQAKSRSKSKSKSKSKTRTKTKTKVKYVCITRTGSCYHTHKCGNGTYFKAKFSVAKARGLRPCKKCY